MAGVVLSCGILVMNAQRELLLCHATGSSRWDIPKGIVEPGETEAETAIREAAEECGLTFEPESLLDLGRYPYRRVKDLYLYAALIERIDTAQCVCSTQFRDAHGRLRAEMDAFEWVTFDDVAQRCGKSMAAALTQRISLPSVLQRLMDTKR
jgi:putative (di)nucleoside polyphosphate hydrolase